MAILAILPIKIGFSLFEGIIEITLYCITITIYYASHQFFQSYYLPFNLVTHAEYG